jgi:beta-lactam-binding protein with PASTA domain
VVEEVWRFDPDAVQNEVAFILRPKGLSRKVTVPDVVGKSMNDARLALVRAGLRSEVQRDQDRPPPVEGRVVLQDPEPGARVRRRSPVRLLLTFRPDQ